MIMKHNGKYGRLKQSYRKMYVVFSVVSTIFSIIFYVFSPILWLP